MTIPSRPIGTSGQQIAVREADINPDVHWVDYHDMADFLMIDGKRYRATSRDESTGELYLRECPKAVEW